MGRTLAQLEHDMAALRAQIEDDERRCRRWAADYLALLEAIPGGYPDGTGGLSPLGWIEWAKGRLGYADRQEGGSDGA